jgi:hypothetical protein
MYAEILGTFLGPPFPLRIRRASPPYLYITVLVIHLLSQKRQSSAKVGTQ